MAARPEVSQSKPKPPKQRRKPREPALVFGEAAVIPPPVPLSARPDPRKRRPTAGVSSAYLNATEADERCKGDKDILRIKLQLRDNIRVDAAPARPQTAPSPSRAKSAGPNEKRNGVMAMYDNVDKEPAGIGMEHLNIASCNAPDTKMFTQRKEMRDGLKTTDPKAVKRVASARRWNAKVSHAGLPSYKSNLGKATFMKTTRNLNSPSQYPGVSGFSMVNEGMEAASCTS